MKKIFTFFLFTFSFTVQLAYSQYSFEYVATNSSDCFSYYDDYSSDRSAKYFLINPSNPNFDKIRFRFRDINFNNDMQFVGIYAFNTTTWQIGNYIAGYDIYSGSEEYNSSLLIDAKALIIEYYPDDYEGGAFFDICYDAVSITLNNYNYTALAGTFDDGSSISDYSPNLKNTYKIKHADSAFVELSFINFSLNLGDNVVVYDGETESYGVLGTYTYNSWPTTKIRSTGNAMCLVFNTDGLDNAAGWSVEYRSLENRFNKLGFQYDASGNLIQRTIVLGPKTKSTKVLPNKPDTILRPQPKFSEKIDKTEIVIYPNPTQGQLKVDITGQDLTQKTGIYIYNLLGNLIKQVSPISGSNVIDLSEKPNGTYIMRVIIGDKSSEWKIIKE